MTFLKELLALPDATHARLRRGAAYGALVLTSVLLVAQAWPLMDDGAQELRQVHLAMNDEELILSRVWSMVDKGGVNHGVAVYPGLYPYTVAAARILIGPDAPIAIHVETVRGLSCVEMLVGMWLSALLISRLTKSLWAGVLFALFWSIHPETVLWAARVHPDALLFLFNNAALLALALHTEERQPRWLVAATVFAALSAATKLVGVFTMAIIGLSIFWEHRRNLNALIRTTGLHAGLFLAVFAVCNPRLLTHTRGTVMGWLEQSARNQTGPHSSVWSWLGLFWDVRSLGAAGVIVAVVGLAGMLRRDVRHRAGLILAFGLVFLTYLVVEVNLVTYRYAAPSAWALALAGLCAACTLFDGRWRRLRPVALALCAGVYFAIDFAPARRAIGDDVATFELNFTEAKREVAAKLLEIAGGRNLTVVTEANMYVPPVLAWDVVWDFDGYLAANRSADLLVEGPLMRRLASAETRSRLRAGDFGFQLAAILGDYVIYSRPRVRSP